MDKTKQEDKKNLSLEDSLEDIYNELIKIASKKKGNNDDGLEEVYKGVFEDIKAMPGFDLLEYISKGGIVADYLKIDKEEMEAVYVFASRLYQGGCYDHAISFFARLALWNPYDWRFFTSLAHCYRMLHLYEKSYQYYCYACAHNSDSPQPHFYAAEVALKLNKPDAKNWAKDLYQRVLAMCANKPEHQEIFDLSTKRLEFLANCQNKKTQ